MARLKKTVSLLLALCMIITLLPVSAVIANAHGSNGIYGNGTGGVYIDIYSYEFKWMQGINQYAYTDVGCAWFAAARVWQLTGNNPNIVYTGPNWWNNGAGRLGYSAGRTIAPRALACYKYIDYQHPQHVAVIEAVSGDMALVSEGGRWDRSNNDYCTLEWKSISKIESDPRFLGYVYLGGSAPALQCTWDAPSATQITQSNAFLYGKISYNRNANCTQLGVRVVDASNTTIASKDEYVNYKRNYVDMWYDITGELGVTLSPGTTYKYSFYAIINGEEHWSPVGSFTTEGYNNLQCTWDAPSATQITQSNAFLYGKISYNQNANCTQLGVRVVDASNAPIASKDEYVNYKKKYVDMWYDITGELGVTLSPGTTYKYSFYAIINGEEHWSPVGSFTTEGYNNLQCIWDAPSATQITQSNAFLYGKISYNQNANCTQLGVRVVDASNAPIASKDEYVNYKKNYVDMWYDITEELGVTLSPGTTYKYSFYAIINGEEHWSSVGSFTTEGHNEVRIEGKSATCTETGLTDGVKCSVCGEVIKAQEEIPALGHNEVTIKGKSATCTEKGLTDGVKCSVCGEVIKAQEEIAATGHKFNKGVCTVCGAIDPDYKVVLNSTSKQIKVDNKSKVAVFIPASSSGMKVSEFKKQFNSEINVSLNNNALVANGAKFKFNNTEFTVIVKGDVNGDGKISALDARTILRISAKLDKANNVTFSAADVNGDGKVTASEARRVLRFSAKLESSISN